MKEHTCITDFIEDVCCTKTMLVSMGSYGIKWEAADGRELLLNHKDYVWAFEKIHN